MGKAQQFSDRVINGSQPVSEGRRFCDLELVICKHVKRFIAVNVYFCAEKRTCVHSCTGRFFYIIRGLFDWARYPEKDWRKVFVVFGVIDVSVSEPRNGMCEQCGDGWTRTNMKSQGL